MHRLSDMDLRQESRKRRINYHRSPHILIVKIPCVLTEVAISSFGMLATLFLCEMGLFWDLLATGAAHVEGSERTKCPYCSYRPFQLPRGRSRKWPSVVVVASCSRWCAEHLAEDAKWWLLDSQGEVRMAITIEIEWERKGIVIDRWETAVKETSERPVTHVQRVRISAGEDGDPEVIGGPLVLPFENFFLRKPSGNEGDLKFGNEELAGLAKGVWAF
ncbi:hypothetical protein AJ79_03414 [Helicocarpus griseus UAMH5409]|uniref:Uncharacterized protein n=1 Tax=Helicocarpus griseus UAMH5409 TaxID=1447875 RepID=A0A2B7XXA6_9EURO|nr:hypothetical protein AJ79_03414 [Helicocarpus griseus UAMH5409]